MQLGKKSKATDMFEKVRGEQGTSAEELAPLVSNSQPAAPADKAPSARASTSLDREAIHVTIAETITAKMSREGSLNSFSVKGDLQLRIADSSLTKVKLELTANATHKAQFRTHPNVDKALFNSAKAVQLKDPSKGFPANQSVGVLRWSASAAAETPNTLPITFTVWVNKGSDESWNIMVEYESTGGDSLRDVSVTIPYATSEPAVSSFDALYEVSGDSLEWNIGTVDESNSSGAFEFEAQAADEGEFFPMSVRFAKSKPFVDVDVSCETSVIEGLMLTLDPNRSSRSHCWIWIRMYRLRRMSNLWLTLILSSSVSPGLDLPITLPLQSAPSVIIVEKNKPTLHSVPAGLDISRRGPYEICLC